MPCTAAAAFRPGGSGKEVKRLLSGAQAHAFRYGASNATDIDEITQDVGVVTLSVRRDDAVDLRADKVWVLTVDMDGQSCDAYISQKNSAIWINDGTLESGSKGDAVYQTAGAYARNTACASSATRTASRKLASAGASKPSAPWR